MTSFKINSQKPLFVGTNSVDKISILISRLNYLPKKAARSFGLLKLLYSGLNREKLSTEIVNDGSFVSAILKIPSVDNAIKSFNQEDLEKSILNVDPRELESIVEVEILREYYTALNLTQREDLLASWSSIVKSAIVAKEIAKWLKSDKLEIAFLGTFFRFLPALVLTVEQPEIEQKINSIVEQGVDRGPIEVLVRGFTEPEFAARLLKFYSCHSVIVSLFENGFEVNKTENPRLIYLINLANLVAKAFNDKNKSPSALWNEVQGLLQILDLNMNKEEWADKISCLFVKSLEFENAVSRK